MGKRLAELDYLRAIACLAVIIVHVSAGYLFLETTGFSTKLVLLFLNRSLVFVVPVFLFLSGLVLTYNYQGKKINYPLFIKKRAQSLLGPYFFWMVIFYGLFVQQGFYKFSPTFFAKQFFLGDLVYHLYFVVLIMQFYLLFGVFQSLFAKFKAGTLFLIMFVGNVLFMKFIYFPYVDRFFLQYLCFFALGCYFGSDYLQIKNKIYKGKYLWALLYFCLSGLVAWQFYGQILLQKSGNAFLSSLLWLLFSLVAILFYFSLALALAKSKWTYLQNFLNKVSKGSYSIYLSHPLVLMLASRLITPSLVSSTTLNFLATLFFVGGVVISATFIFQKIK